MFLKYKSALKLLGRGVAKHRGSISASHPAAPGSIPGISMIHDVAVIINCLESKWKVQGSYAPLQKIKAFGKLSGYLVACVEFSFQSCELS